MSVITNVKFSFFSKLESPLDRDHESRHSYRNHFLPLPSQKRRFFQPLYFFSSNFLHCRPSRTNIRISPISPPPPPAIDHSIHSPFVSVKQPPSLRRDPSPPPVPVLLPPSAFQIHSNEIQMPLSSRPTAEKKVSIPHRPYSTQPSSNLMINKDNLLDVKQRLEIYMNNKAKLKYKSSTA